MMKISRYLFSILILLSTMLNAQNSKNIGLIIRADDMGFCSSANQACIKAYQEGIVTSVEVLVPAPWFLDAAELLRENPGLDAGVHLTLTSEWSNMKYGPISTAEGLVDQNGYFPESTEEMLALNADEESIKNEFRTQIELAKKHIPQLSHISTHMFGQNINSTIEKVILELADEYNLKANQEIYSQVSSFWAEDADKKEDALAEFIDTIGPGINLFILHPAFDTEETRAIKGTNMDPNIRMAVHRQKVTEAVMSERIKALIEERDIQLINFVQAYSNSTSTSEKSGSEIWKQ